MIIVFVYLILLFLHSLSCFIFVCVDSLNSKCDKLINIKTNNKITTETTKIIMNTYFSYKIINIKTFRRKKYICYMHVDICISKLRIQTNSKIYVQLNCMSDV